MSFFFFFVSFSSLLLHLLLLFTTYQLPYQRSPLFIQPPASPSFTSNSDPKKRTSSSFSSLLFFLLLLFSPFLISFPFTVILPYPLIQLTLADDGDEEEDEELLLVVVVLKHRRPSYWSVSICSTGTYPSSSAVASYCCRLSVRDTRINNSLLFISIIFYFISPPHFSYILTVLTLNLH